MQHTLERVQVFQIKCHSNRSPFLEFSIDICPGLHLSLYLLKVIFKHGNNKWRQFGGVELRVIDQGAELFYMNTAPSGYDIRFLRIRLCIIRIDTSSKQCLENAIIYAVIIQGFGKQLRVRHIWLGIKYHADTLIIIRTYGILQDRFKLQTAVWRGLGVCR